MEKEGGRLVRSRVDRSAAFKIASNSAAEVLSPVEYWAIAPYIAINPVASSNIFFIII